MTQDMVEITFDMYNFTCKHILVVFEINLKNTIYSCEW